MSANNVNWQLVFQLVSALRHLGHDSELFERTAQELYEEMQKFGWRPMAEYQIGEEVILSFINPRTGIPDISVADAFAPSAVGMYLPAKDAFIPIKSCHGWMPLPEPLNNHKPNKNE